MNYKINYVFLKKNSTNDSILFMLLLVNKVINCMRSSSFFLLLFFSQFIFRNAKMVNKLCFFRTNTSSLNIWSASIPSLALGKKCLLSTYTIQRWKLQSRKWIQTTKIICKGFFFLQTLSVPSGNHYSNMAKSI